MTKNRVHKRRYVNYGNDY